MNITPKNNDDYKYEREDCNAHKRAVKSIQYWINAYQEGRCKHLTTISYIQKALNSIIENKNQQEWRRKRRALDKQGHLNLKST